MRFKIAFRTLIFLTVSLCFTCSLMNAGAFALSASIDKPRVEITAPAGTTNSGFINVRNKGQSPISVQATIEDWIYDENNKRQFRPPGSTSYSCAEWIFITPQNATIPPGGNLDFNYNIKIPEDAEGGKYAVMFFESSGVEDPAFEGMGVKLVGRIGSMVYLEIEGRTKKEGSIQSLELTPPHENKPLTLTYTFKNEGNAFIGFKSILNILNKEGVTIGFAESEKGKGTLPGDAREDSIKWFGSITKGKYDVILTVDMGEDVPPIVRQETIEIKEDIL